ncbi:uncharacterized protein [Coffea arabica]|uniref:Endonuclease/exonuclease/phosphatase n=1 Tax=Coffea arabica TaxID=13443 RepID=A0A6P6TVY7_COFAR|nr:uncharacterized protein LOC113704824 [Coffea arabica]
MAESEEFLAFIEEAGVFDAGFFGSSFTWSNNRRGRARIWKRLDRLLINEKCLNVASAISVVHLARHPSDHSPLRISFASRLDNKPRLFRFLNVWAARPDLLEASDWNKQSFGNVFDAVREAEAGVLRAEAVVENETSEKAQIELQRAQAELTRSLAIEEQFWRQKARVKWLRSGDRNTKYFHAVVKQRRVHEMIHRIRKQMGNGWRMTMQ